MSMLLLYAALVAGVIVLTPVSDRLRVPLPVTLTLYGLLLPLVPGTPTLRLRPELILPVVLPPLLFAATQRTTVREFRREARPIVLLAVGLTVASAAAAAWVAHAAGLPWGAAWVLGAIVSPPDPVAATAVARRLRLPSRLVTLLEGEGMFNDATALVLYGATVTAVVSGHLTPADVLGRTVLAVVAGVAVGLAAGALTRWGLAWLHDAAAETTLTVAVPFAVYLLAERMHGSGVLAVLTLGLFLRSYGHPALSSAGWLLGRAVWRYADYLITSLVFVLIGFELTAVLRGSSISGSLAHLCLAVIVTLVLLRMAWVFPASAAARLRLRGPGVAAPARGRETVVAGWAGMRGVVTVATALALPLATQTGEPFPHRDTIIVVGLTTVLATLVLQGLSLVPLVRLLGVGTDEDPNRELATLRDRAATAALDFVRATAGGEGTPEPVQRAALLQYEGYLSAQKALTVARTHADAEDVEEDYSEALEQLLRRASEVERDVVLDARRRGEVSAEVADEVLADVERRAVRDLS